MSRLTQVAQQTDLSADDVGRLNRLAAELSLLSDLSFSDLVLWLPTWSGSGYVAAAQQRPSTGSTVFAEEVVGAFLPRGRRPLLDQAVTERRVIASDSSSPQAPVEVIPVPGSGRTIAVLARYRDVAGTRASGRLETAYLDAYAQLVEMVAAGRVPIPADPTSEELSEPLRVGDGTLRLDEAGTVVFASPNALSALRRLGLTADPVATVLADVLAALLVGRGPVDEDLQMVASGRGAGVAEAHVRGAWVRMRGIPLRRNGRRTGALILLRDVTDVRVREADLLSKDATIREIHHRVKNNLQAVASLLRLQARRVSQPEARAALEEAMRRVGAIALVHEMLSAESDETVDFDAVADQVMATSTDLAQHSSVDLERSGTLGRLPAEVATPLALVLNELLQNAMEHAVAAGGRVRVRGQRGPVLRLEVADSGPGLPPGFDPETSDRLGLRIVRTLVEQDLSGSLEFAAEPGGGLCVSVAVPLAEN